MAILGNLMTGIQALLVWHGTFCMYGGNSIEFVQPSDARCAGYTITWIKISNWKIPERCIMALPQSFAIATSPACLPTLRWRLARKVVLFTFQRNLHAQPELMCLKQVMCLSYSHQMKKW